MNESDRKEILRCLDYDIKAEKVVLLPSKV
jgi:hypothetical protein